MAEAIAGELLLLRPSVTKELCDTVQSNFQVKEKGGDKPRSYRKRKEDTTASIPILQYSKLFTPILHV